MESGSRAKGQPAREVWRTTVATFGFGTALNTRGLVVRVAAAGVIVVTELELWFGRVIKTGGVDKELEFSQSFKRAAFGGSGNCPRISPYWNGTSSL
jgi:hypothetical protein